MEDEIELSMIPLLSVILVIGLPKKEGAAFGQ